MKWFKSVWQGIRQWSGDDAYERYLQHYAAHHAASDDSGEVPPPLSREAFYREWQENKWNGIKRCC